MQSPADTGKMAEGWPYWSILVVDDEPGMRNFLVKTLAPRCQSVMEAGSAEDGAALLRNNHVDLIILDIALPGMNGVAWLKELREHGYTGQVILITAFADLDTAIEALRAGASDFILKPFRVPQILNAVRRCYESARLARENFVLRHTLSRSQFADNGLVGGSPQIGELSQSVRRVAPVNSTVLLQGESGTGKELVARALHALSPRAHGPFVPVNCASVSPAHMESELFGHAKGAFAGATRARDGLFYYAQGGTLFLDEVAELPLPLQATLLRALEDLKIRPVGSQQLLPVNVRIIAATNRSLQQEVAEGRFRKDLFYRLNVIHMVIPPLRDRVEDIPLLALHFLDKFCLENDRPPMGFSPDAMRALKSHAWPGNVRELQNVVERAVALCTSNMVEFEDLPDEIRRYSPEDDKIVLPVGSSMEEIERQAIVQTLKKTGGDKELTARLLGIGLATLYRRLKEMELKDVEPEET